MAKNALSVTKLYIKVNHLEEEYFQLNKRVSMLEAEKENHKKIQSTPKIIQNESAVSKNDSPLTRIGKDFIQISKFNCYFILSVLFLDILLSFLFTKIDPIFF